jgi:hypothetical protein
MPDRNVVELTMCESGHSLTLESSMSYPLRLAEILDTKAVD